MHPRFPRRAIFDDSEVVSPPWRGAGSGCDRVQQEPDLGFGEDFNGDGEVATPDDMRGD